MKRDKALITGIAVLALALTPVGLAGKGHSQGGSTGSGYTVSVSPGGPYSFGQSVSVVTNVPLAMNAYISMKCMQNGVVVGTDDHANFAGGWYYQSPFQLGPSLSWESGSADCTFKVWHYSRNKQATDASTTIRVNG